MADPISIGNHINSSVIWEIIALSHVLAKRNVIARGEAECNLPSNTWRVQVFHENSCD